eukprot:COSAG01_NODE_4436_length_5025_cov_3.808161_2_plen_74_part_00
MLCSMRSTLPSSNPPASHRQYLKRTLPSTDCAPAHARAQPARETKEAAGIASQPAAPGRDRGICRRLRAGALT